MQMRGKLFFLFLCLFELQSCVVDSQVIQPSFLCGERLEKPYGICSHISRLGENFEFDTRYKELEMIDSLRVDFIRTDFDWHLMRSGNGDFSSHHLDKMMEPVIKKDKMLLGILSSYKPAQRNSWIDNHLDMIKHFRSKIRYWEVLNEPDLLYKKRDGFTVNDYLEILKTEYSVIRQADSTATIVFSGIADSEGKFVNSAFAQKAHLYCDIMNIHRYTVYDEPEVLCDYYNQLGNMLKKYNVEKSIWLTETGYATKGERSVDEYVQAQRLPRIFLISFAFGVEKVFWYKSRASEIVETDRENHFGIWHKDYTPKPAFMAYRTLTEMCPNNSTRPVIEKKGDLYVATWKRPDNIEMTAVWCLEKKHGVKIKKQGVSVKCYDIYGKMILENSKFLNITSSLTYIEGNNKTIEL